MPAAPSGPPAQYTDNSQHFNTLAILAFVLVWLTVIVGLVLGYIALSQIKRTGERGHGLALAAVVIGWIGVGLGIIALIFTAIFAGWFIASNPGGTMTY
jgi:uncharacterized membrane protein